MKRRDFIALVGAATVGLPRPAHAQKRGKKIPRVGIIDDAPMWNPFRQAMRDAGYVEGKTIAYEYRVANSQPDRLTAAAAELVRVPVDLIATFGTPPSLAAKAATSTIPIVVISVGDPVGSGLVQSLARPGGNVTGNTILSPEVGPKRLQLIKEIMPDATRVAVLWNPDNLSNSAMIAQMRATAPTLGLAVTAAEARNAFEIDSAFGVLARDRPNAVMVTNDPVHQANIRTIIDLLARHNLPAMFQSRDNVAAGGLMSYGPSLPDLFRGGAAYAQKVLQGTKPADLPVQPPEGFELAINLRTARAIGLKISEAVLLRADEVIE